MSCLIVKCSSLGDILQTFPAVAYLKQKGYSVDWVCEDKFAPLLASHPDIDKLISIHSKDWPRGLFTLRKKLKQKRYDDLFDLQGNCKSGLVSFLAKANRKVGYTFKTAPEWPSSCIATHRVMGDRPLDLVQNYFGDSEPFIYRGVKLKNAEPLPAIPSPALMICPGSNWPNKQLSIQTWRALLENTKHHLVIIWGTEPEQELAEAIANGHDATLLGRLPFGLWQALMRRVDGIVGVDSSSLHLAATTTTPAFTVFGPSHPAIYKPSGAQYGHYWGTCPYHVQFNRRCPHLRTCKTGACLKNLDAQELKHAFDTWLAGVTNRQALNKDFESLYADRGGQD